MRLLIAYFHVSLVLGVTSTPAMAQEKKDRKNAEHPKLVAAADRIVERFMKEHQVPGLAVVVVRDGEVVVEKGYGIRSQDDKQVPDSDTLFYIGSLSKALTGVGVTLLAERGKIKLDDPISHYVKGLPKAWQSIPVKYYLAHQSGIPEAPEKKRTFLETVQSAENLPMMFKPGTKQVYNNFNFAIAGKAIEGASGKPYLDFMKEEVFKPLGMTRSGFGQTDENSAPGHRLRKDGTVVTLKDVIPNGGDYGIPSGFLQTTAGDLLKLYRAIESHKLLTQKWTHQMVSPVTEGLSGTLGWFVSDKTGIKIVGKNGAAAGYSSQFQFAPAKGHAVIFIMNLQTHDLGTINLAHDLLRDVCGIPLKEGHLGKE